MPRIPVDDLDDPRLAMYRRLKATNLTRDSGQFVVEGEKLFDRLLSSTFPIVSVLVSDRHEERITSRVPSHADLFVARHEQVEALVGFNFHRGVLACASRRPWPRLDNLLERAGGESTLVVCPRLDNPENLGAIVRIADVFGAAAVLVGDRSPDPLSRRVLRVSMGSALRLPVIAVDPLEAEVERLRSSLGFTVVATVIDHGAEPLDSFRRPARLAVVLGSEGHGLDDHWIARADRRVTIPMRPGAESLNVAVAAGILLYALTKDQRLLS